jgi:hypothetical protein
MDRTERSFLFQDGDNSYDNTASVRDKKIRERSTGGMLQTGKLQFFVIFRDLYMSVAE